MKWCLCCRNEISSHKIIIIIFIHLDKYRMVLFRFQVSYPFGFYKRNNTCILANIIENRLQY